MQITIERETLQQALDALELESTVPGLETTNAAIEVLRAALAAQPAPAAVPPNNTMEKALRRAFSLGQTYWQQADSDYTSEHKKSDVTRERFEALVAETIAAAGDKQP